MNEPRYSVPLIRLSAVTPAFQQRSEGSFLKDDDDDDGLSLTDCLFFVPSKPWTDQRPGGMEASSTAGASLFLRTVKRRGDTSKHLHLLFLIVHVCGNLLPGPGLDRCGSVRQAGIKLLLGIL